MEDGYKKFLLLSLICNLILLVVIAILLTLQISAANSNVQADNTQTAESAINDLYKEKIDSSDITIGYTTSAINVRKLPGATYEKLGVMSAYEEIQILEYVDGWVKIVYGDDVGYIKAEFVIFEEEIEE